MSIKYFFSKFINKIQLPSLRNCTLDKYSYVCSRANLINVSVGRYSYIGANNSMQNVEIGSFCSIGSYVAVGGKHPLESPSTSPVFYDRHNCFKENSFIDDNCEVYDIPHTIIGNDVWIGDKVFINAGVKIGDGAVLGANAVITHDVPAYAIVAGVPARLLRYRFDDEIITELLEARWWEWSEEKILRNKAFFAKKRLTESDFRTLI